MTLTISTTSTDVHLYVTITAHNTVLLTVQENQTGSIVLVPGVQYYLDWHAITGGSNGVVNTLTAVVTPATQQFPNWHINTTDKNIPAGHRKDGGFPFTV